MKTVTLTEARRRLGTILADASAGQRIRVTRRGRDVFVFAPGTTIITHQRGDPRKMEQAMKTMRRLRRNDRVRPGSRSASEALHEMRNERLDRLTGRG